MREILAFVIGSVATFSTWLYPPFHKVDYYILVIEFIIILTLCYGLYWLYGKKMSSVTLSTKAVQVKKDRIVFKVNIKDLFFINGISTLYIKSGSFIEPVAIVIIENVQDNNLIQVKIKTFIKGRVFDDLDLLQTLVLRPCVDISLFEGETYNE